MALPKMLTAAVFCSVAPTLLTGQTVELRSPDNFISVTGEITDFNGTMVTILTAVGPVNVPAAQVVCFGANCNAVFSNNDFGLTAAAFAGVVDQPLAPGDIEPVMVSVSTASPAYQSLYRTLGAAFAANGPVAGSLGSDEDGQITLDRPQGRGPAVLTLAADGDAGDVMLAAMPLSGPADLQYAVASDWALADAPDQQLIGLRAFAVVTGPGVGIDAISRDQIAGIFAGDITNWSQIGGADLPVLPLQLPVTSEIHGEIVATIMDPVGKTIADQVLTIADENGVVAALAGLAGSISLIDPVRAPDAAVMPVTGDCGIAVPPTPFNVASGDYPLLRPVMALRDGAASDAVVTTFFDFAATSTVQDLLARDGFTSFSAVTQPGIDRNARLGALLAADLTAEERPVAGQMFQTLFEAERLSVTMIGGATSGSEGAWNRAMMQNLADMLQGSGYTGRTVIFAGFGTSTAGPQAAIDSSVRMAADAADAFGMFAADIIDDNSLIVTPVGFGAVSPSTCYSGQVDADAFTRVEVWIK